MCVMQLVLFCNIGFFCLMLIRRRARLMGRNRTPRHHSTSFSTASISSFAVAMSQDQTQEKRELPVKFSVIPETLESPFKELFPAYTEGLVSGNPGNFVYHPLYGKNADKFYNFPIRKDDVWIRTFPRSGIYQG